MRKKRIEMNSNETSLKTSENKEKIFNGHMKGWKY